MEVLQEVLPRESRNKADVNDSSLLCRHVESNHVNASEDNGSLVANHIEEAVKLVTIRAEARYSTASPFWERRPTGHLGI
jgi:hypothetical protein